MWSGGTEAVIYWGAHGSAHLQGDFVDAAAAGDSAEALAAVLQRCMRHKPERVGVLLGMGLCRPLAVPAEVATLRRAAQQAFIAKLAQAASIPGSVPGEPHALRYLPELGLACAISRTALDQLRDRCQAARLRLCSIEPLWARCQRVLATREPGLRALALHDDGLLAMLHEGNNAPALTVSVINAPDALASRLAARRWRVANDLPVQSSRFVRMALEVPPAPAGVDFIHAFVHEETDEGH